MRRWALAAATAALMTLSGCEDKITLENYERITPGMTLAQVEGILGSGTEDSAAGGVSIGAAGTLSGAAAPKERIYLWRDGGRQIVVTFVDGKVAHKHTLGLDPGS